MAQRATSTKSSRQPTQDYRAYVKSRLDELTQVFAKASVGDFSVNLKIPGKEDEFTELFAGIQIMLEVIREKTAEYEKLNKNLLQEITQKTAEIITVTDNSPQFIEKIDRRYRLTFINHTLPQLKKEEVLGKNILDFLANPADRASTKAFYDRVFKNGKTETMEVESIGANDTKAWYKISAAPVKDPKTGQITELVISSDDITDLKQAQEDLSRRTEELEKFNALMIGREIKMAELKKRVSELEAKLGKEPDGSH